MTASIAAAAAASVGKVTAVAVECVWVIGPLAASAVAAADVAFVAAAAADVAFVAAADAGVDEDEDGDVAGLWMMTSSSSY